MDITVKEALAHGVTTVGSGPGSTNVFGGTFACIKTYGECVDDMLLSDSVAMKSAFGEVVPLQYLNICAGLAVRAGMDKWEALRAISLYPASFMKQDHKVGSIKVGKDADIVIWNDYPLSNFALPNYVLVNGKLVEGIDK